MKKALQLLLCTLLFGGFLSINNAAAQTEPQDVTIRDLNTYDNLENYGDIPEHPLVDQSVTFTAVVVSYPKSSGLSGLDPDGTIGRIHMFIADTSANSMGQDGMYMRIVNAFETPAFPELENLSRGAIVNFTGELTFFGETSQFEVAELVEVGNVTQAAFQDYQFLLEPVPVDPSEYHTSTGPGQVQLDLEAYQKYNNMYVSIENGTTSNYNFDDGRVAFSVVREGVFTGHRDISLRYRNDKTPYRTGYNYRRDSEGDFEPPPIGSSVNISGFLSTEDLTEGGLSFSGGGGFFISPMEDGVLWVDESTRLVDGENGFEWPDDFELVGSPPQVLSIDPDLSGGIVKPDSVITISVPTAAPENDPSVTIDSVVVNYTTSSGGTERFQMNEVTSGEYEFTLPELVAFESPSIFVQAYGSNGLVGRFPTIGSISFYVDGGAITSIETIQRTGDDLDGSSPVADIQDLEYNIAATVVSTASDGVISVQDGSGPWSGIFLALESSTVGLQRGDVVNITGGTVREASVSFNDNTYTYLEDVILNVQSSGADLSTVVPVLTTNEFNAPNAPGEAWEGMLVRFENVQMTAALEFGEFEIISVEGGTLQAESVVINDDTRAGAVGETGFPDDFNLHARIDSTLNSVSGLVTYTFGAAKIIPRELEDITGNNYTIPRPVFNLNTPGEGASVGVVDGTDIVAEWQSLLPRDYDFNTVTFEWVLYEADSTEIIVLPSDNEGASAQITIPGSTADGVLANLGLNEGESIEALWNVRAIDPDDTVAVAAFIDFDTFEPETIYRPITLTRGEATSNEDFGGIPRTFDLEQNYPNPFNPTTQINYAVPEQSDVRIDIYNVIGRRVATLVDREMAPGNYTVNFNASQLSSGMYFYRLKAGSTLLTKKMTLIK